MVEKSVCTTGYQTNKTKGKLEHDLKTDPPCHPRAVSECGFSILKLTKDISVPFKV